MRLDIRLALAGVLLAAQAAQACTVNVSGSADFGVLQIGAEPASTTTTLTAGVTCPSGIGYSLGPSWIAATHPLSLSGGGTAYLAARSTTSGTLLRQDVPSSLIHGTGTGLEQTYSVDLELSGSGGVTDPLDALGFFSASLALLEVERDDTGASAQSAAQLVSGEIEGVCTISSTNNIDYGSIPVSSSEQQASELTAVRVTCTDGIAYDLFADSAASGNSWINDRWQIAPGMEIAVEADAGGAWQLISQDLAMADTGAGVAQTVDLRLTLTIDADTIGTINGTLQPTVRW